MSPLKHPDFNLLYTGRLFSTLGVQMLAVAIGWQVYAITHDPLAIGMIGLCQFVPSVLLALFAGEAADKFDRRLVLAFTFIVATLAALLLLVANMFGFITPVLIYIVAFVLGVIRIFSGPAAAALLPNVVPDNLYSKAVALNSTAFQIATITGPVLAGLLLGLNNVVVYAVAALMLFLSIVTSLFIKTRTVGNRRAVNLETMLAGIKFIMSRPVMLGAISLDLFAVLFGGVVSLLPVFAKDILHIGPEGLGLLRCAPAIGAGLMAFVLAKYPLEKNVGRWLFASIGIFGISTIIFGLSTSAVLSFVMLLILGAADMVSVFVRTHLTQAHTPDDMRGRVASVNMLFITTSNELGDFESGLMASVIGAAPAAIVGGVLSLIVGAVVAATVPGLRKLDRL